MPARSDTGAATGASVSPTVGGGASSWVNLDLGSSRRQHQVPPHGPPLVTYYECDYDLGPSDLYQAIEAKQWPYVREMLANEADAIPLQAATWVVRKEPSGKLRWRLLPLHACMIFTAPRDICSAVLEAFPAALSQKDDQGMLPLHLAFRQEPLQWELLKELLTVYPTAATVPDRKGRTPLLSAAVTEPAGQVLQLYVQIVLQTAQQNWKPTQRPSNTAATTVSSKSSAGAATLQHPWLAHHEKKSPSPERTGSVHEEAATTQTPLHTTTASTNANTRTSPSALEDQAALQAAQAHLEQRDWQIQQLQRQLEELQLEQQEALLQVEDNGTVEVKNTVANADFYYRNQNETLKKLLRRVLQQQDDLVGSLDDLAKAHSQQAEQRRAVLQQVAALEHDTQATCQEWKQAVAAEHAQVEEQLEQILAGKKDVDIVDYEPSQAEERRRRQAKLNQKKKLDDEMADEDDDNKSDRYSAIDELSILELVSRSVVRNIMDTSPTPRPQPDPVGDASFTSPTVDPAAAAPAATLLAQTTTPSQSQSQDIPVIQRGKSEGDEDGTKKKKLINKGKQHLDKKVAVAKDNQPDWVPPALDSSEKDKTETKKEEDKDETLLEALSNNKEKLNTVITQNLVGKITVIEDKDGFEGLSDAGAAPAVEEATNAEATTTPAKDEGTEDGWTDCTDEETPAATTPTSSGTKESSPEKQLAAGDDTKETAAAAPPPPPPPPPTASPKTTTSKLQDGAKKNKKDKKKKKADKEGKDKASSSSSPEKKQNSDKNKTETKTTEVTEKREQAAAPPADDTLFTIGDDDDEGVVPSANKTRVTAIEGEVEVVNERKQQQSRDTVVEEKKESS